MPPWLDTIETPAFVKTLLADELPTLAAEIRTRMIETVAKNGGHLASSLGTVELTLALARVFDFPSDRLVWDVGHQAYAWKLITGRANIFHTLRTAGGIGGFPRPGESPFDAFIGGHAGVAISAALGMAVARDLGKEETNVIAVVGDGALTNGISLEAANQIRHSTRRFILVINDNEMSISKNVGAFSRLLGRRLGSIRYNRIKAAAEEAGHRMRMTPLRHFYHALESAVKSLILRNKSAVFEGLGLRYVGPIDGHDLPALEEALTIARESKIPIVLHIATQKGRGYAPARRAPGRWHGVGPFDPENPPPRADLALPPATYSDTFGAALCRMAETDPAIVAVTAAMRDGTGLTPFFLRHPRRAFDVGICEEHACTFAAGLAASGQSPFVAIYSTFIQRAVDNVMHDICLQNLPVTLCLDRAGIVGADGPTHHGVFDIPMLRCLPNLTIMQPRSLPELTAMLEASRAAATPCVIRYPRTRPPEATGCAPLVFGKAEVLTDPPEADFALWALGDMVPLAQAAAEILRSQGRRVIVVNARFIKPLDTDLLLSHARRVKLIATFENGALAGGFGSAVSEAIHTPTLAFGWPDAFVPQGETDRLFADAGLTPQAVATALTKGIQS